MADKLQRPEDFEFALDFLGDPEASELRSYIEQLEARAAQAALAPAGEVEELVQFLRDWGDDYADEGTEWHRAADLLEQLSTQVALASAGEVERRLRELAGGEQLMVYYWPKDGGSWEIQYGNPSRHVMLGEVDGAFRTDGATLQEAVDKLAALLAEDDAASKDAAGS